MRHSFRPAQTVAILFLGALLVTGCGGSDSSSAGDPVAAAEAEEPRTFTVRGQFVAPALEGAAMRVSHEEMPDYMDAMTMNFRLQDPTELEGIKPGDKIEFEYVADGTNAYVHGIKLLPADTELTLR